MSTRLKTREYRIRLEMNGREEREENNNRFSPVESCGVEPKEKQFFSVVQPTFTKFTTKTCIRSEQKRENICNTPIISCSLGEN